MNEDDVNPWSAGPAINRESSEDLPQTKFSYGCIWLFAALAAMFSRILLYNLMTRGGQVPYPWGKRTVIIGSLTAAIIAFVLAMIGARFASAAIRNPGSNLPVACVSFLLNFLIALACFAVSLSFCFLIFE